MFLCCTMSARNGQPKPSNWSEQVGSSKSSWSAELELPGARTGAGMGRLQANVCSQMQQPSNSRADHPSCSHSSTGLADASEGYVGLLMAALHIPVRVHLHEALPLQPLSTALPGTTSGACWAQSKLPGLGGCRSCSTCTAARVGSEALWAREERLELQHWQPSRMRWTARLAHLLPG